MSYREHVFVCLNERPAGDLKGCCLHRGAKELFEQLRTETRGQKAVRVNKSGCLGRCEEGPVIVRYPSGEWLTHATPDDCTKLAGRINQHGH